MCLCVEAWCSFLSECGLTMLFLANLGNLKCREKSNSCDLDIWTTYHHMGVYMWWGCLWCVLHVRRLLVWPIYSDLMKSNFPEKKVPLLRRIHRRPKHVSLFCRPRKCYRLTLDFIWISWIYVGEGRRSCKHSVSCNSSVAVNAKESP